VATDTMDWRQDLQRRFPDWQSAEAIAQWPAVTDTLSVGQRVVGEVIAIAEFGLWLDIGVGFPALLLLPYAGAAQRAPARSEEIAHIGEIIDARIRVMGPRGEIGLTQNRMT